VIIFFIRHAETEANVGFKTSDPSAISLTQNGRQAAIDFALSTNVRPELIIITSYLRTYQTANPFIDKHPNVAVETWPFHEFTYLSPSACQNTTAEDRSPMVKSYWEKCDPFLVHGPGAESFAEFMERISKSFERLKNLGLNNVFVFSHGQVIRTVKQLSENGYQSPLEAMIYFKNIMLKLPVRNLEVLEFRF